VSSIRAKSGVACLSSRPHGADVHICRGDRFEYAAQLYLIGLEQEARHMIVGKSRFGFAAPECIGPVGIRPIWVGDLTRGVWFVDVAPNA
jgi:hypothetical protein